MRFSFFSLRCKLKATFFGWVFLSAILIALVDIPLFSNFSDTQIGFCDTDEEGALVRKVHQKTFNAYEKFGKVACIGTGCATTIDNKYTCLKIRMKLSRQLSENEARQMMIEAANIFLANINENTEFIANYAEKPFAIKNLDIVFFLTSSSGTELYEPFLSVVSLYGGNITYKSFRLEDEYKYKDKFQETYEEALQKLEEAKSGQPTREELTKKALSR